MIAAARRFVTLIAAIVCGTAFLSLVLGLLLDASPSRSVAVGLYLAAGLLVVTGIVLLALGAAVDSNARLI